MASSHRPAPAQALLDEIVEIGLRLHQAVDARAVGDVLVDRLRERIRLLENHADAGAQFDDVDRRIVDILLIERDLAGDAADVDRVVHAVQAAQEGRLAATGRADQRRDLALVDIKIDIEQRLFGTVEHADLVTLHLGDETACRGGLLVRENLIRFHFHITRLHNLTTAARSACAR